ncbi:unnamed protein product [Hymenolepis diminuta]|uniref:Uncharacterized protein n=1 Tax=Hymenolepis diminuta TaxID=6216 RepID=A0A564XZT4_HYMDI|nr:unnamed protein product [Hymenolepis diminuta]
MQVRFSSIVRNASTQMNLSMSTNDHKDQVKSVGIFQHNYHIGETLKYGILNTVIFTRRAWQISSHTTRTNTLLRKVNRIDHDSCSSCPQSVDYAGLIYEEMTSKLGSVVCGPTILFNLTVREDENIHHNIDTKCQLTPAHQRVDEISTIVSTEIPVVSECFHVDTYTDAHHQREISTMRRD